jgi:hypothetical protein
MAQKRAELLGIILIRASEITKPMPPGHFNAIFLKDSNPAYNDDYIIAIKASIDQGSFLFYHHPPFPKDDGTTRWYPEHDEIYEKGWLHGIEVVNGRPYYPHSHEWCIKKGLTIIGTSDVHGPIHMSYDLSGGEHRPMTLVFTKAKDIDSLEEALRKQRTAIYFENSLIGDAKYLRPLFFASVEIINPAVVLQKRGHYILQIRNNSDVTYQLTTDTQLEEISFPQQLTLHKDRVIQMNIRKKKTDIEGKQIIRIPYKVKNCIIAPGDVLDVELEFNVTFK